MNALTVMVTGVGGAGHGEQILKALRLAHTKYEIVGTEISAAHHNLELVEHAYVVPRATDSSWLDAMLRICDRHHVQAVFHGNEAELIAFARNRLAFQSRSIFVPVNPDHVIETAMDKVRTADFLRARGFAHPKFKAVRSADELASIEWLPVVLKPSTGSGGSRNVSIAQTKRELEFIGSQMLELYSEFIVQEYVGTPDNEFTVGVLFSMDGDFINSIAVRRDILNSLSNLVRLPNRTSRSDLGPVLALSNGISQGAIGRFDEVTGQCERIASELGVRGAVNIQCRLVDGIVYVFEINPRFSGTTSLRAMVGYNEPDILIRWHVLGEHVEPRFQYCEGVIRRSLSEHFLSPRRVPEALAL